MKFTFVFPPFFLDSLYNLPPLGLMNLATLVQRLGWKVELIDFVLLIRQTPSLMDRFIYDRCAEKILSGAPDIVAFSAQCTTYPSVIQIAKRVKAAEPGLKIIIGGHNASFVDRETLKHFPWIDVIVRGEGEQTIAELAGRYAEGGDESTILGVTWRKGERINRNPDRPLVEDLNDLSMPDYGLVAPLSAYRDACGLSRSIAIIEVGRGCPHQCVYCSESALWRRRTRTFSVDRLVNEMRLLHLERGAECFLLAYDQFTANRSFVESFCRKVISNGLAHIPWYCISRLDTVDADTLRLMRSAGCESMCYGIDSGSPRTLAFIGKQIDERILYQRVRETTEEGMVPTLSFVIGFPEEEIRDIDETLMLALRTGVQGNSNPLMQMPTVLPGTRLFERYSPLLVREVDTYFSLGIEFDAGNRITEDESLITHYPDIFSSFYNLPCTALPTTALHKIVSFFPMLVNFYPKSFMLLSFALKRSLSDLFFNWLAYVNGKESRNPVHLTSADCYRHFSVFATHIFDPEKGDPWDHVPQMVLYETSAIEAAGHNRSQSKTRPLIPEGQNDTLDLAEHTVIKSFTKNLSVIVADLKAGIFTEEYPDMRGYLVFHHKKNELNVMEINDFGADFLMLCDGHRTLEVIAELLNARYADGQGEDVFLEDCRATAEELTRFGLIKPSSDAR